MCWKDSSDKEHYVPGDTIVFKRLNKIGEVDQHGHKWSSLAEYTDAVKNMMHDGLFFLEIPPINKLMTCEPHVRLEDIVGHIVAYDEDTITVETFSKYAIPEMGANFLGSLTKKEIDARIRICHRMMSITKLGQCRIISCYLVEKGFDIKMVCR